MCQCRFRATIHTPVWLRNMFGQLFWTYNSSISIRTCNHPPCRKSLVRHHFTYYFPPWLFSRAICASANLDHLSSTGAKMMVNIPLIIPEENHIIWSLVIAGNLEQLRHLLSCDKNLVHVRNQWGQSIIHVSDSFPSQSLGLEGIDRSEEISKFGLPALIQNHVCRLLPRFISQPSSISCVLSAWMSICRTRIKRLLQLLS